jgi:hypothetical protein
MLSPLLILQSASKPHKRSDEVAISAPPAERLSAWSGPKLDASSAPTFRSRTFWYSTELQAMRAVWFGAWTASGEIYFTAWD